MTKEYECEQARSGEIACVVWTGDDVDAQQALAVGKCVQFFSGFVGLKTRMAAKFPFADCWYTERNGDGIALLMPRNTHRARFPTWAMDYMAFEWIEPDKDFGTGVKVRDTEVT